MPKATAQRIAELLVANHARSGFFDVDFMDGPFTRLMVEAFRDLGCQVETSGVGTRLHVKCPPRYGEPDTASVSP